MVMQYKLAGDTCLIMEFENEISTRVNSRVRSMYLAMEKSSLAGVEEVIPTYRSLLIHYNPFKITGNELIKDLQAIEARLQEIELPRPKVIEIPTLYGGEFGPDLEFVTEYNGLSKDEVIKIHSGEKYLIYMLGFTPGFPYLGGMSDKIATPRLENPRVRIPAGSVGIAGSQTGIYPIESPGGWRLIGQTPLKLFNPERPPHFLLQSGDYLRFTRVTEDEYTRIKNQVLNGTYNVKTWLL